MRRSDRRGAGSIPACLILNMLFTIYKIMEIRELTVEDFDNNSLIESAQKLPFIDRSLSVDEFRQIFLKRQALTVTIVAIDGNKIVGLIVAVAHYSFRNKNVATLFDFSVHDQYRLRGIGLSLLKKIELVLKKKHDVIELSGPVEKDLIRFYEKIGGNVTPNFAYMYKTIANRIPLL